MSLYGELSVSCPNLNVFRGGHYLAHPVTRARERNTFSLSRGKNRAVHTAGKHVSSFKESTSTISGPERLPDGGLDSCGTIRITAIALSADSVNGFWVEAMLFNPRSQEIEGKRKKWSLRLVHLLFGVRKKRCKKANSYFNGILICVNSVRCVRGEFKI